MKKNVLSFVSGSGISAAAVCAANAQDVAAHEKSFNECRACHQVGEGAKDTLGPVLNGSIGRKTGTIDGYNYSDANRNSGFARDEAVFAEYIKDPSPFAAGEGEGR